MARLTILHVSDAHFGMRDNWSEQGHILAALNEAAHDDQLVPDICLFTGDLAFSGKAQEYKGAESWLADLVSAWPNTQLFIVPGNHDVDRALAAKNELSLAIPSDESYKIQQSKIRANAPHLKTFVDWHAAAASRLPIKSVWNDPFGFRVATRCKNVDVQVIGLNTAILSHRDSEVGRLVADMSTLNQALAQCQPKHELVIVAAHHPIEDEWLVPWNRDLVVERVSQRNSAHLYFHGHLHEPRGGTEATTKGKNLTTFSAGAAYQGSKWPQFFAFHTVDFTERKIATRTYTYSKGGGDWPFDSIRSYDVPALLPKLRREPGAKRQKGASGTKAPAAPDAEAPADTKHGGTSQPPGLDVIAARIERAASAAVRRVSTFIEQTPRITALCYTIKHRARTAAAIQQRIERRRASDSQAQTQAAIDLAKPAAFRLLTRYPSDVVPLLEVLLRRAMDPAAAGTPFLKNPPPEVTLITSRADGDMLSIVANVKKVIDLVAPGMTVDVQNRASGITQIKLSIRCATGLSTPDFDSVQMEFEVLSVFEDVWLDVDHAMRYGRSDGTSSGNVLFVRHLSVFRTTMESCILSLDVLKRQADDQEAPTPPADIRVAKPLRRTVTELDELKDLPPHIFERVREAYRLWSEADVTREFGGSVGAIRRAADAFQGIIDEFRGQPKDDPRLAEQLMYLAGMERAYLLSYTGDEHELAEAAKIYEEIASKYEADAVVRFRWGGVARQQGDLWRATELLKRCVRILQAPPPERGRNMQRRPGWLLDAARLSLAYTLWKTWSNAPEGTSRKARETYLKDAVVQAKDVYERPNDDDQRTRAVNDLLYYAWEERNFLGKQGHYSVPERQFIILCDDLETRIVANGASMSYERHDTLMRALHHIGRTREAKSVAKVVIEQLIKKAEGTGGSISGGKRHSHAWTAAISRLLDTDERDALVYSQDLLLESETEGHESHVSP